MLFDYVSLNFCFTVTAKLCAAIAVKLFTSVLNDADAESDTLDDEDDHEHQERCFTFLIDNLKQYHIHFPANYLGDLYLKRCVCRKEQQEFASAVMDGLESIKYGIYDVGDFEAYQVSCIIYQYQTLMLVFLWHAHTD